MPTHPIIAEDVAAVLARTRSLWTKREVRHPDAAARSAPCYGTTQSGSLSAGNLSAFDICRGCRRPPGS